MHVADMLTAATEIAGHRPITLVDAIAATARNHPDTTVIIDSLVNPAVTTLAELFDESCRVSAGLAAYGIRPGDVVATQIPNWRECIVAHTAVWMAGAVLVPIVPIYGPHEVSYILQKSGAKALVIAERLGNRRAGPTLAAIEELPGLSHRFIVGEAPRSTVPYSALSAGSCADYVPVGGSADQHCLLVYTSGTTAEPKGVQHTHASLLAEIGSVDQMRTPSEPLSVLSVFPSGHIAGVLNIIRTLTSPATTVLMDAWDAGRAAHLISANAIGASAGAPIHLSQILDAARRDRLPLSSLQEFTTGAAGVAGALIRRADDVGIRAFRCYGSTEHPTISIGSPDDPLDRRADTDGRLTPGTEVLLVDDDGREVPAGHEGEILSRGPELFVGYHGGSGADGPGQADGWFRTGDVGRLDSQGFLTITDRKKDIIIRGGENISAREVEDALSAHRAVAEAAVIGSPDSVYGEMVCAFVVLRPGQTFDVREAIKHFGECGIALAKTPERIIAVGELPRTAGGKVQKYRLFELLGQQAERHPKSQPN
jgi:cyclohexanecarboxylate-CoA ligase